MHHVLDGHQRQPVLAYAYFVPYNVQHNSAHSTCVWRRPPAAALAIHGRTQCVLRCDEIDSSTRHSADREEKESKEMALYNPVRQRKKTIFCKLYSGGYSKLAQQGAGLALPCFFGGVRFSAPNCPLGGRWVRPAVSQGRHPGQQKTGSGSAEQAIVNISRAIC